MSEVPVTCWCERHIVHVDAAVIGDATASCGHWQCVPPGVTPTPPGRHESRYNRAAR